MSIFSHSFLLICQCLQKTFHDQQFGFSEVQFLKKRQDIWFCHFIFQFPKYELFFISHMCACYFTPCVTIFFNLSFFFKILFLFIFRERGRKEERKRERNTNVWLPLTHPQLGTWLTTQACALTGNRTGDILVRRPALNPLNHSSQG